jgi:hypothetical protein
MGGEGEGGGADKIVVILDFDKFTSRKRI